MSLKTSTRVVARTVVAEEVKTDSLQIDGANTTTVNIGTPNTGVTATEYGDGYFHRTVLTINQTNASGLVTDDGAALASGYKLYTFPTGTVLLDAAYMSVGVTAGDTNHAAETPDVGLGTVIGSGAQTVLSGVGATCENIIDGTAAADIAGTPTVASGLPKTIGYPLLLTNDDVFFNMASNWSNVTGSDVDNTVDIAGTVILLWRFLV